MRFFVMFAVVLMMGALAPMAVAVEVEEVVVTASKYEEPLAEATSAITIIDAEQIENSQVVFLVDYLKHIPEVTISQNGGPGKMASVFVRGSSPDQTLVMIDGVKVKSATTGLYDFSTLFAYDIERIEIVRGPQSTLYGSEAIGGVINIITKKGADDTHFSASFEGGSYGTYSPSLGMNLGSDELNVRLKATHFKTDGVSAYSGGDEADGYENSSVTGSANFKVSDVLELGLSGFYTYDKSEVDGYATDSPNAMQTGHHHMIALTGKIHASDDNEQSVTLSEVRDHLVNTDPDNSYNESDIESKLQSLDVVSTYDLSDSEKFTIGYEHRTESGEYVDYFDEGVDNDAVYANAKYKSGEYVLTAGYRYDSHETFGEESTYRIGATQQVSGTGLLYRASYGTGFRAPTLNELYYQDSWGSSGNPDLLPERSESWEFGAEYSFGKGNRVSVTYFEQTYENLIQWEEVADYTWQPENVADAAVKGVEVSLDYALSDAILIKAGLTNLDTEDKETGEKLTRRPNNKASLMGDYFGGSFTVGGSVVFVDECLDSAVSRTLDSYVLVGLSGSYSYSKLIKFHGRVDNLLDEEYEEVGDYGTYGRAIYLGASAMF